MYLIMLMHIQHLFIICFVASYVFYQQIYFEAIDLIVNYIKDRFDQLGYKIFQNVQNVIVQVVNSEEYQSLLSFVTDFCASDFDPSQLKSQLHVLSTTFSNAIINQHSCLT